LPGSLDIDRRVFIPVMAPAASRAVPFTYREREFI